MWSPSALGVLSIVLFAVGRVVAEGTEPKPADPDERVLPLATEYRFSGDADGRMEFAFNPEPLLSYTNPIRGEVYGSVFVWTWEGRPEVIGAFFDFRSEDKLDSELHTLSRSGVVGFRKGRAFWNPESAGVVFRRVPAARVPAATQAARRRQMGELARGFRVERNHPEQMTGDMRLLPQPIYRYECRPGGIVEGALFVFVEATDPEVFLLLEATDGKDAHWQFAMARMNIVEFRARYQGEEVWHVDAVDWDTVFDRQEPYAIVRESPSRGLVRKP